MATNEFFLWYLAGKEIEADFLLAGDITPAFLISILITKCMFVLFHIVRIITSFLSKRLEQMEIFSYYFFAITEQCNKHSINNRSLDIYVFHLWTPLALVGLGLILEYKNNRWSYFLMRGYWQKNSPWEPPANVTCKSVLLNRYSKS